MLDRFWRVYGQGVEVHDRPVNPHEGGWSFQWRCSRCGCDIAEVRCYTNGQPVPYRFIASLCSNCWDWGDKFNVPGSLERFELMRWDIPQPILDYQLSVELAFLDHPEHPHNKEYV